MKKIITLLLLAVTMSAFAEDHLKFMGIPINGQLTTFCQQLEKKNFKLAKMYSNAAVYEGLFTGRVAYILVETTPKTNIATYVYVLYKDKGKWNTMESIYYDVKEQLAIKYGAAVDSTEIGGDVSDYLIKNSIENGEVKRYAQFETASGTIVVGIDNFTPFDVFEDAYTYVAYIDKANRAKAKQEEFDDL